MTKTIAKFKTCQDYLTKSFGERNDALQHDYKLLDKAIDSDDKEMILAALQNISGIVTTSPLQDLQKFIDLYNDESEPLFDF